MLLTVSDVREVKCKFFFSPEEGTEVDWTRYIVYLCLRCLGNPMFFSTADKGDRGRLDQVQSTLVSDVRESNGFPPSPADPTGAEKKHGESLPEISLRYYGIKSHFFRQLNYGRINVKQSLDFLCIVKATKTEWRRVGLPDISFPTV